MKNIKIKQKINPDIIMQARRTALVYILDNAAGEKRSVQAKQVPAKESQNVLGPAVGGAFSFFHYQLKADEMRREGYPEDAIKIYNLLQEGMNNGALDQYVNDPALLRMLASGELLESPVKRKEMLEDMSCWGNVSWNCNAPFERVVRLHYPFSGRARAYHKLGLHAAAGNDYYISLSINHSARAYEGAADSVLRNPDHMNVELLPLIKANSDLNDMLLIGTFYKYQNAIVEIDKSIKTFELEHEKTAYRLRNASEQEVKKKLSQQAGILQNTLVRYDERRTRLETKSGLIERLI